MAVASRTFTVVVDNTGAGETRTPPMRGWFLFAIRFLTPQAPRVRLANTANLVVTDSFLNYHIADLGILSGDVLESAPNDLISDDNGFNPVLTTAHWRDRFGIANYGSQFFNNVYPIVDRLIVQAVPAARRRDNIAGSEWDVEIIITDNVAGDVPLQPFPQGFDLIT